MGKRRWWLERFWALIKNTYELDYDYCCFSYARRSYIDVTAGSLDSDARRSYELKFELTLWRFFSFYDPMPCRCAENYNPGRRKRGYSHTGCATLVYSKRFARWSHRIDLKGPAVVVHPVIIWREFAPPQWPLRRHDQPWMMPKGLMTVIQMQVTPKWQNWRKKGGRWCSKQHSAFFLWHDHIHVCPSLFCVSGPWKLT